ncbi:hypothetical protein Misp01_25000 [Microtetraspora sp. NBRC 13810]|uniref:glycosyltransferase family 2 protein n=1 Tax=Microtetraspora sp. NBRC 13810 TaxID=3030990 RepID=UPI00249FA58E|nr:glycosyltransferase family 2 protein [Microtetraspora sp. NBRC 13810]GLW07370.1 hypothetical protein Misp01_25000 [Microtetraspora sp. NBRC 13810]
MGVKVSVVVPLHNPGDTADVSIRSALEQSLPPEEYEVIFADDGSTDGTAARLDTVAATRDNMKVFHLDRTGSPMQGRNVGLTAARGDYVYLMEQGDRLERDAVARMYDRAVATEADVLLGRLVQDVPAPAFQLNRDRADILRDRLLGQLTVHKLYRRAFVEEQGLRFAENGSVLSEQAFVLHAYLTAKVIAILADEVCCRVAARPGRRQNFATIAAELDALLDVVDRHTVPGRLRERIYAHWLRTGVLRPFNSPRFLSASQDRSVLYRSLRELTVERFPERLDLQLPVHLRAVAALLRAGRLDQLITLAGLSRGTRLHGELDEVRWDGSVMSLALRTELVESDGTPLRFQHDEGRLFWRPPTPIDTAVLPLESTDVTEAVARTRLSVYIRHAESGVMHLLPTTSEVQPRKEGAEARVQLLGEARLDVGTAAAGRPLVPGLWEVYVRAYGGAYQGRARVGGISGPLNCVGVVADHPRRLVVPCWSDLGELGVCVEPKSFAESISLVSPGAAIARQGGHVFVVVPVPYVPPSGGPPVELVLRNGNRVVTVPALAEPGIPGRMAGQLVAKVTTRRFAADGFLSPGVWSPFLRVDGREVGLRFGLEMRFSGKVEVRPAVAADPPFRLPSSRLRRLAFRMPGATQAARLADVGRKRYPL